MLRVFAIGILVILAAAAGFFVPRFAQVPSRVDYRFKFPDQDPNPRPIAPNVEYACATSTQAETFENRLDGPTANASAGRYADRASLKITSDGKGVVFSFLFDLANAPADADAPIPITTQNDSYMIASRTSDLEVVALILDVKTLRAVFSYTGQGMIGIRGKSILLACQ